MSDRLSAEEVTGRSLEIATSIMQTVFLWDEEKCLSAEGRAGIGGVADLIAEELRRLLAHIEAGEGENDVPDREELDAAAERIGKVFQQFQDALNAELGAFAKATVAAAVPYLKSELETAEAQLARAEAVVKAVRVWKRNRMKGDLMRLAAERAVYVALAEHDKDAGEGREAGAQGGRGCSCWRRW